MSPRLAAPQRPVCAVSWFSSCLHTSATWEGLQAGQGLACNIVAYLRLFKPRLNTYLPNYFVLQNNLWEQTDRVSTDFVHQREDETRVWDYPALSKTPTSSPVSKLLSCLCILNDSVAHGDVQCQCSVLIQEVVCPLWIRMPYGAHSVK